MSLIPWKKEDPLSTRFGGLQREMNRMFEDFFGSMPHFGTSTATADLFPALTTSETEKQVLVRAEIPGVAAKDIEVSLTDNVLTIKGEKKEERKEEKESYYRMERSFGSFLRQVTLPAAVDAAGAESKLEHGVLELRFPKLPEREKEKKIQIKVM